MSNTDASDERIIADMQRRLRQRALLIVLTSVAVVAAEFVMIMGFHMVTLPVRWQAIARVTAIAALIGVGGAILSYRVTRLPPEALSARIALRHSDRVQRILARLYLFYPLILGVFAFNSATLAHRVMQHGWQILDVTGALGFLLNIAVYAGFLSGRGVGRTSRLIYQDELFQSFRTRGYVAGFWSILAGLLLILVLGLTRPAWAVEALPILIAVGVSVPATTIALLNRRAERDA